MNMTQKFDCSHCGAPLAEFTGTSIISHRVGIRIEKRAYEEDLAWLVCQKCGGETPFDASYFKHLLKPKDGGEK